MNIDLSIREENVPLAVTEVVGCSIVLPLIQLLLVCLLVRLKNLLWNTSPSFFVSFALLPFLPPHPQFILIFINNPTSRRIRDPEFDPLSLSKLSFSLTDKMPPPVRSAYAGGYNENSKRQ